MGRQALDARVAIVARVYGHPCHWQGTLFDPGPGVPELADALFDVDGTRLVVDAFDMPAATDAQRQQLRDAVASINFER